MSRRGVHLTVQHLARLQWRAAVLTGIAVPVVAAAAWVLLRLALVVLARWSAPWEATQLESQGAWVVPLLATALTWAGAARVARRAGALPLQHGLVVGIVAAATCLVLWTVRHGSPGVWALLIPVLMTGAGWHGGRAAQAALAEQDVHYAATSAIAHAQSPAAVAAAIGTHLAHPAGHTVALWQVLAWTDDGLPTILVLLAAWPDEAGSAWRPGRQLCLSDSVVQARLRRERAPVITSASFSAAAHAAWDVLGVKTAQLIPLLGADGRCTALLMVRAPSRRSLTRGGAGRYLAVGAQTELVLERFRLLEQGSQLGMLAERQRLARELHDSIKQQMFAAGMQIGAARALLRHDLDTAAARLEQADALVQQMQFELAAAIQALRPLRLDDTGLAPVLHQYAMDWARQHDIDVELSVEPLKDGVLTLDAEQALLRIAQEALANVARHSNAGHVRLALSRCDGTVQLSIGDDGSGFVTADPTRRGYGLLNMRERAAALGGGLRVESTPGRGTLVICRVTAQG